MDKSKEWLEKHWGTIGGTGAAKILGKSRFGSRRQYAEQILNPALRTDIEQSPDIRRGRMLEPVALELLRETETPGKIVQAEPHNQDVFLANEDYPWAHALPDAWLYEIQAEEKPKCSPVEIKWPRPNTFRKIFLNGLLDEHMVQAQHTMAVMGEEALYFAVCCCVTMDMIFVPIKYDPDFVKDMMAQEEEFYDLVVKRGKLPDDTSTDQAIEVPKTTGEMVRLTGESSVKAARAYLEAQDIMSESKELLETAKERLIVASGDAAAFEIHDDGGELLRCYHKFTKSRSTFNTKKCIAENPEMSKYYEEGKPSRPFKAYPMRRSAEVDF